MTSQPTTRRAPADFLNDQMPNGSAYVIGEAGRFPELEHVLVRVELARPGRERLVHGHRRACLRPDRDR